MNPAKAWSTAGQALTGFAGVRRNPSHFTFYLPLRPRCRGISHTQPHVACFMKVHWQALIPCSGSSYFHLLRHLHSLSHLARARRTRLRTASRRARGTPLFSTRLRLPCISSTSSSTGSVRVGGRFWVETLWRIAHGQTQRAKTSVPRPRHPTRGR